MPKRLHTDEQIIAILREADAGAPITELCRQRQISPTNYHRWKAQYGGPQVDEAKRLRALDGENRRSRPGRCKSWHAG